MTIVSPFTDLYISGLKQQYMLACRARLNYKQIGEILLTLGFSQEELTDLFIKATINLADVGKDEIVTIQDAMLEMNKHDSSCVCLDCKQKKGL